jgi:hypothetical protein
LVVTHLPATGNTSGINPVGAQTLSECLPAQGGLQRTQEEWSLVSGFAKFLVVKKPATKARKGINPFTKEPTVFKAKPARKIIKARPFCAGGLRSALAAQTAHRMGLRPVAHLRGGFGA